MIIHFCSQKQAFQFRINWQSRLNQEVLVTSDVNILLSKSMPRDTIIIHEHSALLRFMLFAILKYRLLKSIRVVFDIHDVLHISRFSIKKYYKYFLYIFVEILFVKFIPNKCVFTVSEEQEKALRNYFTDVDKFIVTNFGGVEINNLSNHTKRLQIHNPDFKFCYFGYVDKKKIDYSFYEELSQTRCVTLFGELREVLPNSLKNVWRGSYENIEYRELLDEFDGLIYVPSPQLDSVIGSYLNIKLLLALSVGKIVIVTPKMTSLLKIFEYKNIKIQCKRFCAIYPSSNNLAKLHTLMQSSRATYQNNV